MQTNTHVGRLVKPIEIQSVGENNLPMVRFCLAVPRGGSKQTDFIYYQAFNKTAELLAKYGQMKGQVIEVEFEMQTSNTTSPSGERKYYQNNVIQKFQLWSSPRDTNHEKAGEVSEQETQIEAPEDAFYLPPVFDSSTTAEEF